jgi:acetolactate synthase I/II/III large subunit
MMQGQGSKGALRPYRVWGAPMYGSEMAEIHGHAGEQTIAAVLSTGTEVMFTLNGGHIWPFYEAARNQGMRVVDTRHEQTATFAAEAYAKLTRRPGLAVLTAGPGITNGVSAITSAHFNGSPLLVLGGRAPAMRWGAGSLQELDHVPIVASVTKSAGTITNPERAGHEIVAALTEVMEPHRGPVFRDFPLDVFGPVHGEVPELPAQFGRGLDPDPEDVTRLAQAIAAAERPAFIIGSDVYFDGAEAELHVAVDHLRVPCYFNGLGRGMLAADHDLAFLRTRALLKERADLVVVFGTPLDFRLGFGRFGGATVMHVVDAESQRAHHVEVPTVVGDHRKILSELARYEPSDLSGSRARHNTWITELRAAEQHVAESERAVLTAGGSVISPGRIYGELRARLARDAVVICDGGDFASYAGKLVEVQQPGCWLDTGPYGCLGNGLGYAVAARVVRPSSQVVVLLGDGAAGFSLMDVDTLVRHKLPVVMVVGNNGMWGLEKHPMQAIYGWDMACDLQPECRYDEVVRALGGGGETVTDPEQVGPALDRAFASGVPYLVNVMTDPADIYPRTSNLA